MTDIDELERLAKSATPGPWVVCQHLKSVEADQACTCGYRGVIFGPEQDIPMAICQQGHDQELDGQEGLGPQNYPREVQIANGRWIAAANPTAILELITELKACEAARKGRKMKSAIGFIASWSFFWLGHWVSRPMEWWDWADHLYTPYNWLMLKSVYWQNWGGKGPWNRCEEGD